MSNPPPNSNGIIDWAEAMQQCGDDEEFLRELLDDLRSETDTQMGKIAEIIQNPQQSPFHRIMRASHVIKGASANLMCQQLRTAALNLEQAASAAHAQDPSGSSAGSLPAAQAVQEHYAALQHAVQQYKALLQSIGV